MGSIHLDKEPVCLFCAVTYKNPSVFDRVLKDLSQHWGCVRQMSEIYDFSEITQYYSREMGSSLHKRIVVFEALYPLEMAHRVKIQTNELEKAYEKKGLRQVNLDPGYLTEAKVVLFSTKDFYHRVYIGEGIFGEITLTYRSKKGFEPFPWTFPDYQKDDQLRFLNQIREWYRLVLGRKRQKTDYKISEISEDI